MYFLLWYIPNMVLKSNHLYLKQKSDILEPSSTITHHNVKIVKPHYFQPIIPINTFSCPT